MAITPVLTRVKAPARRRGGAARLLGRIGLAAASAYLLLVLAAVAWPQLFTGADPLASSSSTLLLPPGEEGFLLGTDQSGRDVFARLVHGARISVGIGLIAAALASTAGLVIGAASAIAPRWIGKAIERAVEILMALPEILLALIVVAVLGKGVFAVALAVTLAAVPGYVRLARAQTLVARQSGYVEAALISGIGPWRRAWQHVLPNTLPPVAVLAVIGFGTAIVSAAALGFLGLGVAPPTPEWGLMLYEGRNQLHNGWWITLFPGLALTLTVVSASVLGRAWHARSSGSRAVQG